MAHKFTVAIDVDGVLATYDGWKGLTNLGDPIPGAVEMTHALNEAGYKIIIHTTRINDQLNKMPSDFEPHDRNVWLAHLLSIIRNWLDKHEFAYHEIWQIEGKPIAHIYLDDRALACVPMTLRIEDRQVYMERVLDTIHGLANARK